MRQLALALHHRHDAESRLPRGVTMLDLYDLFCSGWQLHLLPYVERDAMYRQALDDYRRQISFDTPVPHPGFSTVVPTYTCPADDRTRSAQKPSDRPYLVALTSYLGVSGTDSLVGDGVLYKNSLTRLADVTDGTSNTLLIGERPPSSNFHYGWWYAGVGQDHSGSADMVLAVRERVRNIFGGCGGVPQTFRQPAGLTDWCGVYHFWSLHAGGANFAFCDGSVRFLAYAADAVLPALATRAGGEAVAPPD
jgi:prepilin-type processing-associated H-X9-DG protein